MRFKWSIKILLIAPVRWELYQNRVEINIKIITQNILDILVFVRDIRCWIAYPNQHLINLIPLPLHSEKSWEIKTSQHFCSERHYDLIKGYSWTTQMILSQFFLFVQIVCLPLKMHFSEQHLSTDCLCHWYYIFSAKTALIQHQWDS